MDLPRYAKLDYAPVRGTITHQRDLLRVSVARLVVPDMDDQVPSVILDFQDHRVVPLLRALWGRGNLATLNLVAGPELFGVVGFPR